MRRVALLATLATLVVTGSAGASVDFWMTQAGSTAAIASGSTIHLNAGDPVDMSLWFSTTDAAGTVNAVIGYAQATSWGDSATPTSTPLLTTQYDDSLWSSGSSKWSTNNFASGFTTMYPSLGGGYSSSTGAARPWGLFQGGFFSTDEARTNQRIFDFHFLSSLAAGDSVTLALWDASTAGEIGGQDIWTTDLVDLDGNVYRPGSNYTVTLQVANNAPVPEPSTLLALLTGAGGMAGLVLRRRK